MKKNILFFSFCCLMGMSIEMLAPAKTKKGKFSSAEEAALLAYQQQGNQQQGLTKKEKKELENQAKIEKIQAEKEDCAKERKKAIFEARVGFSISRMEAYSKRVHDALSVGGRNLRKDRKNFNAFEENRFKDVL